MKKYIAPMIFGLVAGVSYIWNSEYYTTYHNDTIICKGIKTPNLTGTYRVEITGDCNVSWQEIKSNK